MLENVLIAAWAISGIATFLRWKFSEKEVSLLDAILCVFLGALIGAIAPTLWLLHSIKLKGGQDVDR